MSGIDIFSKIVVPIISILTFLWAIVSIFITYGQNKKLASFETVSDLMFELYNDFQKNLYPKLDRIKTITNDKEEIVEQMRTYQNETKTRLNEFIKAIHTNRFLIEPEIYESLLDFEECATNIFNRYEDKIHDTKIACPEDRFLSREDHRQLEEQAIKLREYYEQAESLIEEYIFYLQVG